MFTIGIDSGSTATKGVLFDGERVVEQLLLPTGVNPSHTMRDMHQMLRGEREAYTVTTGYGRDLLKTAEHKVTEITCHSKGAAFLGQGIDAIIDIGGQDSKVILLDRGQNVMDFLMNDKCAAGTGRFVEVVLRILQKDFCDLDEYIRHSTPTKVTSMCAVFAESEVISLLAQQVENASIARGVIESICERTAVFARRLPIKGRIFFSGGLAQSEIMRSVLEQHLGLTVMTHPMAQFAGAIGAAIIGHGRITKTVDTPSV